VIRRATAADAADLLALQRRLDAQSSYMMLEPGERGDDTSRLQQRLSGQRDEGSFDLVAEEDGGLAGWLSVEVLPYRRARHVGYLVLGVDANQTGRGLGGALLAEAVAEARRRGLRRLELTVMTDNLRALGLYLRAGFAVEGLRRQSVMRDGELVDEYYMAHLLAEDS
jgi:RimJ/RimL family protein N-acetyltransferase